ncbi:MAG: hypothetical protein ABIO71_03405 [Caldimonas sp.]
MNQQMLSELVIDVERDVAGGFGGDTGHEAGNVGDGLSSFLRHVCRRELRPLVDAHGQSVQLCREVRHGVHAVNGCTAARFVGWVERIADDEVTFRIVGRAGGREIDDRSIAFRLGASPC